MYLPTHRAGAEMHQNLVRLRDQIRQAENLLLLADLYPAEAEDLLKPIQALVDDEQFWLPTPQRYVDSTDAINRAALPGADEAPTFRSTYAPFPHPGDGLAIFRSP